MGLSDDDKNKAIWVESQRYPETYRCRCDAIEPLPICDDYFETTHRSVCCIDCGHKEICHTPFRSTHGKQGE